MIALTDTLPQYLNGPQIDSLIAHELIHVKRKHARLTSFVVIATFLILPALTLSLRGVIEQVHPLWDVLVVFAPVVIFYYFSRRAEFEADREAVLFTGDPETAIRALLSLCRASRVPLRESKLSSLFQSHPSLQDRLRAIAVAGDLPEDRMNRIVRDTALADLSA